MFFSPKHKLNAIASLGITLAPFNRFPHVIGANGLSLLDEYIRAVDAAIAEFDIVFGGRA
jgi:hypothetical protein